MGSVQYFGKCPDCGGVKFVDSYYKSGESYSHCKRCGVSETYTLIRNEDDTLSRDEKGQPLYKHRQSGGYGVFGIFQEGSGFGHEGTLKEPITAEAIERFRENFGEDGVDEEKSYLAKWENGTQTLLLGTQLPEMNSMDFDAFIEKKQKEKEPYEDTLSIKGLDHLTKSELLDIVTTFLREKLNFVEEDFKVTQISLVGSRLKGTNREDSDLDIAFEYEGRYRADSLCDTLNSEHLMIDDIQVDFIPYSRYKGNYIVNHAPIEHLLLAVHSNI